ncbi:hypothetical protein B0J13DRAFT_154901 [Dactylonectria estremocensis]|uniref:ER transporter 6TM N-terminal domain-containing protein n=1 Tax=Dactylonectria estremocensis TaxID=1079267 RepID=A0A9P9DPS4_9HYPO|nr:hypothetical protein B0J13DRAFT_154901 [Dactylonectria estremocensis]
MSGSERDASPSGNGSDEKPKSDSASDDAPDTVLNPYFTNAAPSSVRKLPPWLDHFNAKDLKKLFRCSLAVWIMTILIFINPTLKVMGQAAFLGCIVLFIAPPAGIVFVHLIAATSILLGLTSAWAWGVITMKAALATRPEAEMKARYGELTQMAQNSTNPTQYVQVQVLNGYMLDVRVSLTYFFMMGLYLYLVARLRVRVPKLMLLQIMACIVSTIFLTQAPLLPTFRGNIGKVLVLPCAIAEAIAIVCNIFIFPTSSSTQALDGMGRLLASMPTFLDACLLGLQHPSLGMSTEVLTGARQKILTGYKQLDPVTKFLPIDFSIGRWSSDDLCTLNDSFRQLIIGFTGLLEVHRHKEVRKAKAKQALDFAQATEDGTHGGLATGRHQINRAVDFHLKANHPERAELVRKGLKALSGPTEPLVESCKESIEAISEGMLHSNAFKSVGHADMLQRHTATLEKLRECRDTFINATSGYMFEPSHRIFDDQGVLQVDAGSAPSLTGIMLGLLIKERLTELADKLELLLSKIVELETTRTKLRLWLPTRLRSLFGWLSATDLTETDTPGADIGDTVMTRVSTVASNVRLPKEPNPNIKSARVELASMKTPNSRKRSGCGRILLSITNWLGSAEGIYGLRMVVVSLALSIPAVIQTTAGFYYREKGMWAVIMAQLALVPYTADVMYGIIVRAIGTIVGGVVGMAAWYIGAGNGPGNPYGEAAIMALVIVVFMWWRLFSSPALMPAGLMMAVTAYLVVAYSWIDTHNPVYGNPGVGYDVFWRRLVLVFAGFGGTLVVNFLPKPPSANRHYRHLLADSLASVRDQYALFASNWKDPASDLREVVEEEGLGVAEGLLSIAGPIKLTVFEFSSSNFDSNTLSKVCNLCMLLNQCVTQMLLYTADLTEEQRAWIIPSTGAIRESFIAELMAVLSLVQQTLKSGDPLPAILPTPLFAKAVAVAREPFQEGADASGKLYNKDSLDDEDSRKYVVILNAFLQMLAALDELVLVLKKAVGETSNIGFLEAV